MLVLSRKSGQSIMIGDNIEITLIQVSRGYARLGVVAPPNTPINRSEIAERLKKEGKRLIQSHCDKHNIND